MSTNKLDWVLKIFTGLLGRLSSAPSSSPSSGQVPQPTAIDPSLHYLSEEQIKKIVDAMGFYSSAVNKVSLGEIPWQAIAAIHYREAEFAKTSKIPGGPFQLDPGKTGDEQRKAIDAYAGEVCHTYGRPYNNIETDFEVACLVAAHELKGKYRKTMRNADNSVNEEALADALWGYNGRATSHTPTGTSDIKNASWKYSPYVSNDPKRGVTLRLRGTIPDASSPGGRKRIDIEDKRPGALVVYYEICNRVHV